MVEAGGAGSGSGGSRRGATAFVVRGDRNFGVDFRGGDLITLSAPGKIDIGQVRGALKPIGLADASIQESTQVGRSYITIRTPLNTSDKVEKQVMQTLPSFGFRVEGSERVGALVGGPAAQLGRPDAVPPHRAAVPSKAG